MTGNVDLFGDPVPANWGRRGRPEHVPTQRNRDRITIMLAQGRNNEYIAGVLGVSLPTLRKCYPVELKARFTARARLDVFMMEKLVEGVREGKVAAIKALGKSLEKSDQMSAESNFLQRAAKKEEAKEEKLGKKAQRQANAEEQTRQGRFAVPQAPRRMQ